MISVHDFIRLFSKLTVEHTEVTNKTGVKFDTESLYEIIKLQPEIQKLVTQEENQPTREEYDRLVTENAALKKQVDQYSKDRIKLAKHIDRIEEVYKYALNFVLQFLTSNENQQISTIIENLKKLVQQKREIKDTEFFNKIESGINDLKNAIYKDSIAETPPISSEKPKYPSLLTRWLKSDELPATRKTCQPELIDQFRVTYLDIINSIRLTVSEVFITQLNHLAERISRAEKLNDFSEVKKDILLLLQDCISKLSSDNQKAAEFIKEIGKKILDIEKGLLNTVVEASGSYQSQTEFGKTIEKHIDEISDNVNLFQSLGDLKETVLSKLTNIKEKVQKKINEDMARKAEFDQKVEMFQIDQMKMKKKINEASEYASKLENELHIDPLTGAANRRKYEKNIQEEWDRFLRYKHIFSLMVFDIDHFKNINDSYGHAIGDQCLKEIIIRLTPNLRSNDLLSRYGGEEFVIILVETDKKGAAQVAEKLRRIVERIDFVHKNEHIKITISIGVTQVKNSDKDIVSVFNRADEAMYDAKRSGRNRVVVK
ncbi:MAG: diguanylate cyclase [Desulfobacterales bacterium]|nr:diguanylate cyclase [Desulfobacterales bacterium]